VTLDGTGSTSGIVSVQGNKTSARCDVPEHHVLKGAHTTGIISGGAINNGGKLTLENVTFASNTSFFGGAIAQQACSGCLEPSMIARRCTFTGNRGDSSGGAIVVGGGLLSITDSTFRANTGRYNGVIYLYLNGGMARTVASIDRSTFEANSDEAGGGVIESPPRRDGFGIDHELDVRGQLPTAPWPGRVGADGEGPRRRFRSLTLSGIRAGRVPPPFRSRATQ
jgi:predicted outer membrane repeat protein